MGGHNPSKVIERFMNDGLPPLPILPSMTDERWWGWCTIIQCICAQVYDLVWILPTLPPRQERTFASKCLWCQYVMMLLERVCRFSEEGHAILLHSRRRRRAFALFRAETGPLLFALKFDGNFKSFWTYCCWCCCRCWFEVSSGLGGAGENYGSFREKKMAFHQVVRTQSIRASRSYKGCARKVAWTTSC